MDKQFIYLISLLSVVLFAGFGVFYFVYKIEPREKTIIKKGESPKPLQVIKYEPKEEVLEEVKKEKEVVYEEIQKTILNEKIIFKDLEEEALGVVNYCKILEKQSKSQIIKKLKKLKLKNDKHNLFVNDYDGNPIFGKNLQEDINARTILLEEIHKVRKYKEGTIVSDVDHYGLKRYIVVKSLGMHRLFIGIDRYERGLK